MFRNLLVDLNNLAFTTRHAALKTPKSRAKKEEMAKEYLTYKILSLILSHAKRFNCDGIVIACEGKNIWRKDVYPLYKKSDKKIEDVYYDDTLDAANNIKEFFREVTSSYVLQVDRVEADDVIAVWCQESKNVENYILSSDKDFLQLLNERTHLYSIPQKTFREVPEDSSQEFELFLKCFRGDVQSDNITSAYPRIRKTEVKEAFEDDYKLLNLIEHVLPSGEKVGDLLERNAHLIDLSQQPDDLRNEILNAINNYQGSKFSEFKALRKLFELGVKNKDELFVGYDKPLKTPPMFK